MDIYVLNANYDWSIVIDEFESFIWTERYSEIGDFKLVVEPTTRMKSIFRVDGFVGISESNQIMMIEEIFEETNEDGNKQLSISGRSLECMLEDRVVTPNNTRGTWSNSGTPGELSRWLVTEICVTGVRVTTDDIIPEMYVHDDSASKERITTAIKPTSLYSAVKSLCDATDTGFRIQRRSVSPRLRFHIYTGIRRPNVVFSSALDNLAEESWLNSKKDYKNVAYVVGKNGTTIVRVSAHGASVYITGLRRRVLYVDGSDIDPEGLVWADYQEQLRQRGREALAEHKHQYLFDGEITNVNPYKYRTHYDLGDIVTLMDDTGKKQEVRVTEYIWSYDAQGLKSFPTFTVLENDP